MDRIVNDDEVLLELGIATTATPEQRAVVIAAVQKAEGAVRRFLKYDPVQASRTEFYPMQDFDAAGGQAVWEVEGSSAYLRRLSQAATQELQVRHLPLRSIPAIDLRIDYDGRSGALAGSFAAETQKTEGSDYWPNYDGLDSDGNRVCRDGVIRSAGSWPVEPGSVRIIYTAGYTDEELRGQDSQVDASPIHTAALDESVRRAKRAFALQQQGSIGLGLGPLTGEKLGDYSWQADASLTARLFGGSNDLLPESTAALGPFVNFGWMLAS